MDPLLARIRELERRAASLDHSLRWMRRSRDLWRERALRYHRGGAGAERKRKAAA